MVLSYYSYVQSVIKLHEYNRSLGGMYKKYRKEGKEIPMRSWLDWIICGNVYIVGLSMDYSEMDLWWSFERKSREQTSVGKVYFYGGNDTQGKKVLLDSLNIEYIPQNEKTYEGRYRNIIKDIERRITEESI